jgi:uncharacterized protein (DUF1501 family)
MTAAAHAPFLPCPDLIRAPTAPAEGRLEPGWTHRDLTAPPHREAARGRCAVDARIKSGQGNMGGTPSLTRRNLLRLSGAMFAVGALKPARAAGPRRTLILVKLAGGNDGLNTVVPYADPAYQRARPAIGLDASELLALGEGLGLHPGLAPLEDAWAAGDLAIVRGVGYRPPDRSHFRSMDVWETGGDPGLPRPDGWLTRVLAGRPEAEPLAMLVIGTDPQVAVAGGDLAAFAVSADAAAPDAVAAVDGATTENPALGHVLAVQRQLAMAQAGLAEALAALPELATPFPEHDLGRRLRLAAQLVAAGSPAPVILVPVTGFDTHAGQRAVHDTLLAAVGDGLAVLRRALIEAGAWPLATVATYSEFGRRLAENASGGTDHGTAAPHLVLGGGIAGGWRGAQPSLAALEDQDPVPTTDFRAYLAGLAVAGLGVDPAAAGGAVGGAAALPFIRA